MRLTHHHAHRALLALVAATLLATFSVATVSAHPHTANGQVIANGQNHPPFQGGTSCESFGAYDPAWYGLETAHHGPDAGEPGKGDGCYQTTGNVPPGQDDENPAID